MTPVTDHLVVSIASVILTFAKESLILDSRMQKSFSFLLVSDKKKKISIGVSAPFHIPKYSSRMDTERHFPDPPSRKDALAQLL